MSDDKAILSQDEIDALLGVAEDVELDDSDIDYGDGNVHSYDIASQDRVVKSRMPTLEIINERFARYVRDTFFDLLRQSVDVEIESVQIEKYGDYVFDLQVPTSLNMTKIHPLKGTALVVLSSGLVYKMVDKFYGGGIIHSKIEGRDFTVTEQRLIKKLLDKLYLDLEASWAPVKKLEFDYQGAEMNPAMCNVMNPREAVVVSRIKIDLGVGGHSGVIHIAYPYSMLEPIREVLIHSFKAIEDETDERWLSNLRRDMLLAEMPCRVVVAEKEQTFDDVMNYKVGDIIPFDMKDELIFRTNNVPMHYCTLGQSRGKVAVKIGQPYLIDK